METAEEHGLLLGASKRGAYYRIKHSLVGRAALCALRVDDDCDYFLHARMSPQVSVPDSYFDRLTPPYFLGARAVPAGSPMLVATAEHYAVNDRTPSRHSLFLSFLVPPHLPPPSVDDTGQVRVDFLTYCVCVCVCVSGAWGLPHTHGRLPGRGLCQRERVPSTD